MVSLGATPTNQRRRARLLALAAASLLGLFVARVHSALQPEDVGRPSAEPIRVTPPTAAESADLDAFITAVVQDVDTMWARDFRRRNKVYARAELRLLDAPEAGGCGPGLELGRSDCLGTNEVFIDRSFLRALEARHGESAKGAKAYSIAHELGHHVQRVLGLDRKIEELLAERQVASHWVEVQLELQADCLAGVWSRRTGERHLVEPTELEASLRFASSLGTERRLSERGPARGQGESFTYAIPRRRIYWFAQGLAQGELEDCDTFAP